jgi:hypothetical protein
MIDAAAGGRTVSEVGPMAKTERIKWSKVTDPDDFVAAVDYLSLIMPEEVAGLAVDRLKRAPLVQRRGKDLLRASGLPLLGADNPDVAKKLREIARGKALSPVLCLRGDESSRRPLTIADGYHRICVSYLVDEDADIPCRLAEPGPPTGPAGRR